jgi:FtsP/CotA-like multicopper oxidase with cupredoxin domain
MRAHAVHGAHAIDPHRTEKGLSRVTSRPRKLTRRKLLVAGAVSGAAIIVGGAYVYQQAFEPMSNVGKVDFVNPLAIPPLAAADVSEDGRRVFQLRLEIGESEILPGKLTRTWGINGPLLGPTLRARHGELVSVTVDNGLPEETTIHWHGMHLPAIHDGGPHQVIPAGESWQPEWVIDQPAATLWYHPHPHGSTAQHVYRGIAGLFILDDDISDGLNLPGDYGVDDIPLIIQDKRFDDDGQLSFDDDSLFSLFGGRENFGIMGEDILVNGTYGPVFQTTRRLTRFRILNGSNARFYNLGFDDDRPFRLIATDNGFVPGDLIELTRILIGPGERIEIVVELPGGEEVMLRSFTHDLGSNSRQIGGDDTFEILSIHAAETLEDSLELPQRMPDTQSLPEMASGATQRDFRLEGHNRINDKRMDMSRIDEVVPAGALEVWNVSSSANPHTFHIHGATFHVLEFENSQPPPHLRGPKDTVFVSEEQPVSLAVQFLEYTDPAMPYMFHCHLLRHEDNGMMGQFVVVDAGSEDDVSRTIWPHHHVV